MIYSYSVFGYEGASILVEVDLRRGIPAVDLVGLADSAVKEARERCIAAIRNSGFEFPAKRVLIALSPYDLKKKGASFDLAIALAILRESEADNIPRSQDENVMVMGELLLSGEVNPVKGVYAALKNAVENGIKYAIVPEECEALPDGIQVQRVKNLREAFEALCRVDETEIYSNKDEWKEQIDNGWGKTYNDTNGMKIEFDDSKGKEEFDKIKDCNGLKYAMTVAAAGRHNIIAWGAPGSGKTIALQCMPFLTPKLTDEERQSVQRIWSLAELLKPNQKMDARPFRMPYQTAGIESICGGGPTCRPGEISLAHNGILFLDEAAEFRSSVLQILRVPLETRQIALSRAGRSTVYPANFQLVMAANPCPCGNYGSKKKICLCSAKSVELYWKKFSAPLLDRVQIRFDMNNEAFDDNDMSLEKARSLIKRAWERQYKRQGKLNNELAPQEMNEFCKLSEEARKRLDEQTVRYEYSPRTVSNIIKVARTLHDMFDETESDVITDVDTAIALHEKLPIDF